MFSKYVYCSYIIESQKLETQNTCIYSHLDVFAVLRDDVKNISVAENTCYN